MHDCRKSLTAGNPGPQNHSFVQNIEGNTYIKVSWVKRQTNNRGRQLSSLKNNIEAVNQGFVRKGKASKHT
jgi:hypothetical protein